MRHFRMTSSDSLFIKLTENQSHQFAGHTRLQQRLGDFIQVGDSCFPTLTHARMDLGIVYHIEEPRQFWAGEFYLSSLLSSPHKNNPKYYRARRHTPNLSIQHFIPFRHYSASIYFAMHYISSYVLVFFSYFGLCTYHLTCRAISTDACPARTCLLVIVKL